MRSQIHTSFTGRELVARGPLQLTEDQALAALPQLAKIGIGMDSALVGPAGGNLGTPAQFLQNWLPGIVRQVTKVRNADALMGVQTVGSWEDEEVIQTAAELTGKAELYGDVTNIPLAGYNATYERRSLAVTSNIHPSGYDTIMPKTLATAAVDRLLHHAHVIITEGTSLRLAEATTGRGVIPLT